ncbi:MAG: hypothetical protein NZ929_00075 [Aigarchaeota archaeon]|nr:hypothetical protein [Aigarchaeota archaeon]
MSFNKLMLLMCILFLVLGGFVLTFLSAISEKHSIENPEPGFDETSEYMIGDVAALAIFVNDPIASWSRDEMNNALDDVNEAFNWWEEQASKNNVPLRFKLLYVTGPIYTNYIPSKMSPNEHHIWVSDVLNEMGYKEGDYIHKAKKIVNELRGREKTDWGFLIFMVKDVRGNNFGGEAVGFALPGGPYLVVGWMPKEIPLIDIPGIDLDIMKINEATIAHEIAHIFYATDEYDNIPEVSGYFGFYDEDNSNCLMDVPFETFKSLKDLLLEFLFSMKKALGLWCLSEGTKRQIGWVDGNHNGILDLLEVKIETSLPGFKSFTDDDTLDFIGRIIVHPLPNRNPYGSGRDITIVKIKSVIVTVSLGDEKESFVMGTVDGKQPDSSIEDIHFRIPFHGVGEHDIKIEIENNFGYYKVIVDLSSIHTFVVIDGVSMVPERVDVGKSQRIGFHAIWAHNGEPLTGGTILINEVGSQPEGNGWFYISDTSSSVGEKVYTVTGGEIVIATSSGEVEEIIEKVEMKTPPLKVIYDRISIDLSTEDERIDIGSIPVIHYKAWYEYDKSPFVGKVIVDPEPTSLDYVGSKTFRAKEVVDEKYGLTTFSSNEITVIFDKVIVMLSPEIQRVQVGRAAEVNLRAQYAYDGETFEGKIVINGNILNYRQDYSMRIIFAPEHQIAKKVLEADNIVDEKYGLTRFESNAIELIFDRIIWKWDIKPELFGAHVNVWLRYESDNTPLNDANVIVNGIPLNNLGNGKYEIKISMSGTTENFRLRIERDNFEPILSERSLYNEINVAFINFIIFTIILLMTILGVVVIVRRRKAQIKPTTLSATELPAQVIIEKPPSIKLEEIELNIQNLKILLGKLDTLRGQQVISEADYLSMKSKIEDSLKTLKDRLREHIRDMEKQIVQKEEVLKVLLQKYSSGTISKETYIVMSGKLADEIKQLNESLIKFKKLLESE